MKDDNDVDYLITRLVEQKDIEKNNRIDEEDNALGQVAHVMAYAVIGMIGFICKRLFKAIDNRSNKK